MESNCPNCNAIVEAQRTIHGAYVALEPRPDGTWYLIPGLGAKEMFDSPRPDADPVRYIKHRCEPEGRVDGSKGKGRASNRENRNTREEQWQAHAEFRRAANTHDLSAFERRPNPMPVHGPERF